MDILQFLLYNLHINRFFTRRIPMKNTFIRDAIDYSDCPQNKFYHAPISIQQNSVLIQINRCGSTEQTPNHFLIRRDDSYQYNAIHFVTSGKGTLITPSAQYPLSAGNIFLLNAFEPHCYSSDPEDPMGLLWLEFTGNDVQRLIRRITDSGSHVLSGDADLFSLCADIIINVSQEAYKTSSQIYILLMELYAKTSLHTKKQDSIQRNILSYINNNLNTTLSLEKIANHFGYNSNYFSARFKRMTGVTYNRYVNEQKIAQACSMLTITNLSIDQIGSHLGFYDTSHFIKHFEKITGLSPTAYKKAAVD